MPALPSTLSASTFLTMAEDELDLSEFEEYSETAASARRGRGGGGAGSSARKRRRWPWFVVGLVVGVAGAVFGPDLAAPYLPEMLQPTRDEIRGPVLGKRSEGDRLLLTVDSERGAVLATFRQRVPEIDLLVEEGDTVTLGLDEYAPLVENPVLEGVTKGRRPDGGSGGAPGSAPAAEDRGTEGPDAPPSADSALSPTAEDTLDPAGG